MRDREIRAALREELARAHFGDSDTLILDELGVCQGEVRVDLAVINGALAGFEIKSDADSLARLPRQREVYSQVFDFLTLAVGPKRAGSIVDVVPSWWGICVAEPAGLRQLRAPRRNTAVDAEALVQLLWREEALELLASRGLDRGLRSKPRRVLWHALAEHLTQEELGQAIRDALRCRAGWRAALAPSTGGG